MSLVGRRIFTLIALSAASLGLAAAQVPEQIAYQGVLYDNGTAVENANASLVFSLYTAESGGTAFWTETHNGVSVASGQFFVYLGSVTSLSAVAFDSSYWLEVSYDGTTLSPRLKLVAVPFARAAAVAESVPWSGLSGVPSGFADGTDDTTPGGEAYNCSVYTIPYVPYSSNNTQHIYVSRFDALKNLAGAALGSSTTGSVTATAYSERGDFYDLGQVATAGTGLTDISSTLLTKLTNAGFDPTSEKVAISIVVENPEFVGVFAYTNNADDQRLRLPVECSG